MLCNRTAHKLVRWLAVGIVAGAAVLVSPAAGPAGLAVGRPAAARELPVLHYGASGEAVTSLQRLLLAAGQAPGPIDGKFGPLTRAAVRRFQQQSGLTPDGVAGPATLQALRARVQRGPAAERFAWPAKSRVITSPFGPRRRPCATCSSYHKGMDIDGNRGDPALASKSGVIAFAGWQRGYGNVVYVNHRDGSQTRYAHLSAIYVRQGQFVRQGQVLGGIGNTGTSAGDHLHFEIRWNGRAVDPRPYLA